MVPAGVTFEVRTARDAAAEAPAVLRAVAQVDGRLSLSGMKTLNDQMDDSLLQERLVASLASLFGILAVLLASVGLYGVMAYTVSRRTNEIGIRMALGSGRIQIAALGSARSVADGAGRSCAGHTCRAGHRAPDA